LEGLAENWEIVLFVIGLILLAVEIFVIPGFGVTGILGSVFIFVGLTLSLINNIRFNFEHVEGNSILVALLTVTLSLVGGFFLSLWLGQKLFTARRGPFSRLALNSTQQKEDGFIGVDIKLREMVGKTGIAHTVLRPSGKVDIDGDVWDAMSTDNFIDKGEPILVIRQEAGQLYVTKGD
jgi:membrane-bound serine protease (ClpP class)